MSALLRLDGLEAGYGDLMAVSGVSLEVRPGEAVALIGSNGAGKTTTLRAITGLLPPRGGRVEFDGARIDGLDTARIVALGIAHVPEGRGLFPELTIVENLKLGAYVDRARDGAPAALDRVLALFPRLAERRRQTVRTMSGGERQMVAIARALMAQPRLLLLDEPSLGLSPRLSGELFAALARIAHDVSILMVEQNARRALAMADRAYLLALGRIVGEGEADTLARDSAVARSYLGL